MTDFHHSLPKRRYYHNQKYFIFIISKTIHMHTRIQTNCSSNKRNLAGCQNVWCYITKIYNNANKNLLQLLQVVVYPLKFFLFIAKNTNKLFSIAFVSVLFHSGLNISNNLLIVVGITLSWWTYISLFKLLLECFDHLSDELSWNVICLTLRNSLSLDKWESDVKTRRADTNRNAYLQKSLFFGW